MLLADANPAIGAPLRRHHWPRSRMRPRCRTSPPRRSLARARAARPANVGTAGAPGWTGASAVRDSPAAGDRIASATMDENTRHRSRLPMRARLATTVGGAAATVSRLAGRATARSSAASSACGSSPDLLSLLAAGRQVVLVTGTNGKTTTTRLITAALTPLGQRDRVEYLRREHGGRAHVGAQPRARRAGRRARDRREVHPGDGQGDQAQGGRAAEPEPRPDGPGGRDLAARAPLAGGARQRARTAGWSPTPTTRWSPGRRARRGRSPGWPPASAGARTRGAARTAAPTCSATATTGPAGSAASGGRR